MNALSKIDETPRAQLIKILQDSVWIGAKPESIEMALSYCRVNGLDPFLKPIHIVPMWDKSISAMRDIAMPGIADYRNKAARSGEYAGISEPEYGPIVTTSWCGISVSHPEWCKITIYRIVNGTPRPFTAREEWLENYAIKGGKERHQYPNEMWMKRPKGQLAKCTESQALRKAFPEFSGGLPTAEEMEGKTTENFGGIVIDCTSSPEANGKQSQKANASEAAASAKTLQTVESLINIISSCEDTDEWIKADDKSRTYRTKLVLSFPDLAKKVNDAFAEAQERLFPDHVANDAQEL